MAKKLLFYYEIMVGENENNRVWYYAIPQPNGVVFNVYCLDLKHGYTLVKEDSIKFNYGTKKFSIKPTERPIKKPFNSFTVKDPKTGMPKFKMYFCANTTGMEVFTTNLINENINDEDNLKLFCKCKDGDEPIYFRDNNAMAYFMITQIFEKVGSKLK